VYDTSVTEDRRHAGGVDPPFLHPDYRSTALRAPLRPPLRIPYGPSELSGPSTEALLAGRAHTAPDIAADLTRQHEGEPLGERIIVHGRVLDAAGRPLAGTLVEVWQANAAGRYRHDGDQHAAPLDANFSGAGHCVTDGEGRYRFVTIKPGAYPWRNHENAWRPSHIHFSLFGRAFSQRLITQMYFPGDPLLDHDPVWASVPPGAREGLIARFDLAATVPEWALAYEFDIGLGGRAA
jgi:protocatechuate 3,4-dioxygenase beta subunit